MSTDTVRVPPHAIDAEQAVLGGLLLDPIAWERVADKLREGDFYRKDHRIIFRAIASLRDANQPCDAVTLGTWFTSQGLWEDVDGTRYVQRLMDSTPSAANIVAYAEVVREKSVLRALIDAGDTIASWAGNPEARDTDEILSLAEQKIFQLAESGSRSRQGFVSIRSAVREAFHILHQRFEARDSLIGVSSGFRELDTMTLGLHPADLIILAARPSMGKTALALNIAEHVAVRRKKAVAIFSMEMSAPQLVLRLLASLARVDQQHLRTGAIEDAEWPRLTAAIAMLDETEIHIDDTPALSPAELRARARRIKRQHNVALIVVDYLQLMQVPGTKENRATEISEVTRGLKALAKELNVPVVALSQLNRALEQRTDKRPVMADLRESGSIEQDADVILFIYRPEYYDRDTEEKGVAEVIIGKQRNGPTGTVKLAFRGAYVRFEDLSATDQGRTSAS